MSVDSESFADLLLNRLGDPHPGLRTRTRDWSWDEVVRESAARAALASSLRRNQFPEEPFHIGVLLDNTEDFVFWLGAGALAGAAIVGINPTRGDTEMAAEIRHVDAQLIVTDTAGRGRLRGLDHGLDAERILNVDEPGYAALVAQHRVQPAAAPGVGPETLLLLLFTSGTTGASKAVKCSQGRLVRIAKAATAKFGHVRGDVDYCCMPLFHGNAIMALWAPALANGATICLTPKFSASQFLADVRYFGATFFTYVGKALGYLLATPEEPDDADNTLVRGFGTEASPQDRAEFARRFGAVLHEGYGSSEGGNAAQPDPAAPPGALGRPAHAGIAVVDPHTRAECATAILDEHGRVCNADDAVGEIVDKTGARDFEGYYNNDAADSEKVRDGWYWTGDLGYRDEAGFLYFAGRRGDWIRVDGENTSALTIEQVLRRHPMVISAGVYAVPDPRSGDQVMGAVEVADPDRFDVAAFASYLADQPDLGSKGFPRFLRITASLPVTGSNKVLKRQLQAEAWHTEEPVYRWAGRGRPAYTRMSADDKSSLDAEFDSYGRQSHLAGHRPAGG